MKHGARSPATILRSKRSRDQVVREEVSPPMDPIELRDAILKAVPRLRAFALSLSRNGEMADDLVQEAIAKGLASIAQFRPGTNMEAWLFTILRNQFHTAYRKRRREVEDPEGKMANTLPTPPEQLGHMDLKDLWAALARIPLEQREALLLVGAEGLSYEQAAEICGIRIGTIKSRVNRARTRLAELLSLDGVEDMGADSTIKAALAGPRMM